jgi:hypothetical protein
MQSDPPMAEPATAIARTEILQRIRSLLAEVGGLSEGEVDVDQHLAARPLSYTHAGKLALAARLEQAFAEWGVQVPPSEVAACVVVRDLRILLEHKLKAAGVRVEGIKLFGGDA